mgnify:CR=1 FL=1
MTDDNHNYREENGRFKKGHPFCIGYGRKLTYDTPEKLYEAVVEYFNWSDETQKSKYSMAEAAMFLGFESRQSLWAYLQRGGQYAYIMNRLKTTFEAFHEKKLHWGGSFPGAAFWLKNFAGWKDESIQHSNQTVTKVEFVEKKRDDK